MPELVRVITVLPYFRDAVYTKKSIDHLNISYLIVYKYKTRMIFIIKSLNRLKVEIYIKVGSLIS